MNSFVGLKILCKVGRRKNLFSNNFSMNSNTETRASERVSKTDAIRSKVMIPGMPGDERIAARHFQVLEDLLDEAMVKVRVVDGWVANETECESMLRMKMLTGFKSL